MIWTSKILLNKEKEKYLMIDNSDKVTPLIIVNLYKKWMSRNPKGWDNKR